MGATVIPAPVGYTVKTPADRAYPDATTSTTAATIANGGASYGAWAEVLAATVKDALLVGVGIAGTSNFGGPGTMLIAQVGVGAAGAEVGAASVIQCGTTLSTSPASPSGWYPLKFPVFIPAGSRIAARTKSVGGTSGSSFVDVVLIDVADLT